MNNFHISEKELQQAKTFFTDKSVDVLAAQCYSINQSQPTFTAVVLALEEHGLHRHIIEQLLESIFVVYYAYTVLKKRNIREITTEDMLRHIKWYEEYLVYFNTEWESGNSNLSEINFIRDPIVLKFALTTLRDLFFEVELIPEEVTFGYFSLLKAIETAAENG